jgi:hypothetical protein
VPESYPGLSYPSTNRPHKAPQLKPSPPEPHGTSISYSFDPAWLPNVPFVQFERQCTPNHIATEWTQADFGARVAAFPHRRIQYFP